MATVIFSPRAEDDLRAIGDWVARDDSTRAVTFVEELRAACDRLRDHPYAFAAVEEIPGTRRRSYKGYIIFYSVQNRSVTVLAIRHAARRYGDLA